MTTFSTKHKIIRKTEVFFTILLKFYRQKRNPEKGIKDAEGFETGKYCEVEGSIQKEKQTASCV